MARPLTDQQWRIISLMAEDALTYPAIAERLGIAMSTLKDHLYGGRSANGNRNGQAGLFDRLDISGENSKEQAIIWWHTIGKSGRPFSLQLSSESVPEQQWSVRTDHPHFADDYLPSGSEAWTQYKNYDRLLTKNKMDDRAKPVKMLEPCGPGDRVIVRQASNGHYEATRA